MFGSVGWGIAGIISGVLIDYFSDNNANDKAYDKNYTPIYVISIAVFILDAIWCTFKLEVGNTTTE